MPAVLIVDFKQLSGTTLAMFLLLFLITFLVHLCIDNKKALQECAIKEIETGKIVCVCNATYCDTIPPPEKVKHPKYIVYTSNQAGLRFKQSFGIFTKKQNKNTTIIINRNKISQRIFGWGGAFTDSTGFNILSLSSESQKHLMSSYFSENGIEYSLCRVPIGGTDFSLRGYSYNDGESDPKLLNFRLTEEDFRYKIPIIKQAQYLSRNNLDLISSAWTAPIWMKTNNRYSGFGFLKKKMYQAWAEYHLKFLDSYKAQGIDFWGVTTGNEPSVGAFPFFKINAVGWTLRGMASWIKYNLGPTIRNSSHREIKIIMLDDQRFFLPWFPNFVLGDNITRDYVDGIAVHWYFDNLFPTSLLDITHTNFPEKILLATEACTADQIGEKKVDLGSWSRGEAYAINIIQNVNHWVGSWIDWNMALDVKGGPTYVNNFIDSPIIVNSNNDEFYKQPMFYCLGHFSKFATKGSVRVGSSSFDVKIPVVAFQRPDNGIVLVLLNIKNQEVPVTIYDNLAGMIEIILSAKSITTILYW